MSRGDTAMSLPHARLLPVAALIYLGALLYLYIQVNEQPAWNLDGVFYAACAATHDGMTPAGIHAQTYAEIEAVAPAASRTQLESSTGYRKRLRAQPELFQLQLRLYTGKPLYIWAIRAAHALG